MTEPLRIPIAEARCPWCGSKVGGWSLGSAAACLASGWAMPEDVVSAPTCPVDWRGGVAEQWRDGWFLRLDDPRDVAALRLRADKLRLRLDAARGCEAADAEAYRRPLRACILVGIIQVLVGLALAACWPSDPPALAPVALVLGGCAAMVVGGWPAVRRTWTSAADAAREDR